MKKVVSWIIVCMVIVSGCSVDTDNNGANADGPILDQEIAEHTVQSYYGELSSQRFQLALFHVYYDGDSKNMVMDAESLQYIHQHLDYSIQAYEVDSERTIVRDEELLFVVHLTVHYDDVLQPNITERVTVRLIDDTYQIASIESWDMFLPFRSYQYETILPR